ncbi:MAG: hypothetical protein OXG35_34000 [Acidobacteria bacterium]|nr:hypothetical protein [Acidobacteriota bacterium]
MNDRAKGDQSFVDDLCSVLGRWSGKEHPTPTEIERGMLAALDLVRPYLESTLPTAVRLAVQEHGRRYLLSLAEGLVRMPEDVREQAAIDRIRASVERDEPDIAPVIKAP